MRLFETALVALVLGLAFFGLFILGMIAAAVAGIAQAVERIRA
jgi:hypothetical protein